MRRGRIPKSCVFKPLHHLCKHGVLVENRFGCKGLSALRAAIACLFTAVCVPVVFNAVQAVIVSTGNCYWIFKLVQADRTTERIVVFNTLLCHSSKSVFALETSDDTINLHCYFQCWEVFVLCNLLDRCRYFNPVNLRKDMEKILYTPNYFLLRHLGGTLFFRSYILLALGSSINA